MKSTISLRQTLNMNKSFISHIYCIGTGRIELNSRCSKTQQCPAAELKEKRAVRQEKMSSQGKIAETTLMERATRMKQASVHQNSVLTHHTMKMHTLV